MFAARFTMTTDIILLKYYSVPISQGMLLLKWGPLSFHNSNSRIIFSGIKPRIKLPHRDIMVLTIWYFAILPSVVLSLSWFKSYFKNEFLPQSMPLYKSSNLTNHYRVRTPLSFSSWADKRVAPIDPAPTFEARDHHLSNRAPNGGACPWCIRHPRPPGSSFALYCMSKIVWHPPALFTLEEAATSLLVLLHLLHRLLLPLPSPDFASLPAVDSSYLAPIPESLIVVCSAMVD